VPNEYDAEHCGEGSRRIVAALGPVALYSIHACFVLVGAFSSVVLFRGG
jgi:hypothetical protein